jgi:hypothetical protein
MFQGILHNKIFTKKARIVALLFFVLFLFLFFVMPSEVGAQGVSDDALGVKQLEENIALGATDIRVIIAKIIRAVLSLLGIIAVVIILYGGFLWMTAGGKEDQISKAKDVLRNGVIGLAIILSAFSITQFILSKLAGATGLDGASLSGPPGFIEGSLNSSGLGSIIEDHYPERRAQDIPRNTKIMITFTEAMDPSTLIKDVNGDAQGAPNNEFGDCVDLNGVFKCDDLNEENIKISVRGQEEEGPFVADVQATMLADRKTFIFKPRAPLGSAIEEQTYTVFLNENIKRGSGAPAFEGFEDSYEWYFTVGTFLDLEPPHVEDFSPTTALIQKNRLVQITFNEAMDPTYISGSAAFSSVERVNDDGTRASIDGEFGPPSNAYKTYTFKPDEACGENTCGQTIYCLPGNAKVRPLFYTGILKDPQLSEALPGTGVVDAADNALDGGGSRRAEVNNKADGPPVGYQRNQDNTPNPTPADLGADNFYFEFNTTNDMDLIPPYVTEFLPELDEMDISVSATSGVVFSEEMWYTTLVNNSRMESLTMSNGQPAPFTPFVRRMSKITPDDNSEPYSELTFRPGNELPDDVIFASRLQSDMQDLGQNCFFPSEVIYPQGTDCRSGVRGGNINRQNPSCCNGDASDVDSCEF